MKKAHKKPAVMRRTSRIFCNDVNAGKGAGTLTCAVSYGFRSGDELRVTQPDVLIERFEQLKEFFL